jgi:uncharacterized protein YegJ (DUF2314 family)
MSPGDDAEMEAACARARQTFKFFWRELSWEYRRIVPGLQVASVKVMFADGDLAADPDQPVEHMWLGSVDFDGKHVRGTLLNRPNWLKRVSEGDVLEVGLDRVEDWMYAIDGRAYGGYTVNLMRSRMSADELEAHDDAWGLEFGDPADIRVVPWDDVDAEHPMSDNMGPSLREQLDQNPSILRMADEGGFTVLHQLALAGSEAGVKVCLDCGADASARTAHGMTPRELAEVFGWPRVLALLS